MGLLPCSLLRKRTRPRCQPWGRACRGSAAREKPIVLGAERAARAAGPAAPIPAAATRSARPILPHLPFSAPYAAGRSAAHPGAPPGHASSHRPQPRRKGAEPAPKPTRGPPALSPPGSPQRSAGPALQNGGGSLFAAAAGPRRFHPPSWGNGPRASLPSRPPRMKVLTDAKREGARREPALNLQPTRPSTRLPLRFSSLDKMAAGALPARRYIRAGPPT